MNEFDDDSKDDLNVSKRTNEQDRLSLICKSKISISFKTLNDFSLISKSLLPI